MASSGPLWTPVPLLLLPSAHPPRAALSAVGACLRERREERGSSFLPARSPHQHSTKKKASRLSARSFLGVHAVLALCLASLGLCPVLLGLNRAVSPSPAHHRASRCPRSRPSRTLGVSSSQTRGLSLSPSHHQTRVPVRLSGLVQSPDTPPTPGLGVEACSTPPPLPSQKPPPSYLAQRRDGHRPLHCISAQLTYRSQQACASIRYCIFPREAGPSRLRKFSRLASPRLKARRVKILSHSTTSRDHPGTPQPKPNPKV
ncbi:hypothetical protein QBC39DRAFT_145789 [Podospora conica]|nr:hypothetical protein QBC39DRAFT_145789 [Schizothecium conicum]